MGTVAEYENEFEMLINRVTGIPQSLLIPFYISGLKLHLQRELNLVSRPTTLGDVFSLARIIEARFEDTNNQAVDNNAKALYSASVELLDTTDCFFDCQEIRHGPVIDLFIVGQLAQSLSQTCKVVKFEKDRDIGFELDHLGMPIAVDAWETLVEDDKILSRVDQVMGKKFNKSNRYRKSLEQYDEFNDDGYKSEEDNGFNGLMVLMDFPRLTMTLRDGCEESVKKGTTRVGNTSNMHVAAREA
ncbi:myosin heavy chain-related protein [Tanacetum coccineum]|uniref:Myosin heavy chain-related protein n=1 Tax=Tanacetum coccineum TaxID=301880 RepID=A0ABQ5BR89_9ASTR